MPSPPESAYIIGAAGAAAFFAARRLAGFFAALRAGFRVAFFATFRFAVFFFAVLRPAFFAVLRAGFLAAALRTVVRFFAAFLRAGFLFAVIGIERLLRRVRSAQHATSQKHREICGGCINEAIPTPGPEIPCQPKKPETQYFVMF
jgi:hypothetical protein